MKSTFLKMLLLAMLASQTCAFAANDQKVNPPKTKAVITQASFPGGINKFYEYLKKSTVYPLQATKNKIEGKVNVKFSVDSDGSLVKISVVKGLGFGLDEEAIRLLKSSPKWIPAKQDGKAIRAEYAIDMNFALKK